MPRQRQRWKHRFTHGIRLLLVAFLIVYVVNLVVLPVVAVIVRWLS